MRGHRERLLREALGQYVLIKGNEVIGIFPSGQDAIVEGTRRYTLAPFLVRQIATVERPLNILTLSMTHA